MKYLFILLVSICFDTYSQPSNPCKSCFPAQAGQAGKFLQTNGHKAVWAPVVDSCICTLQQVVNANDSITGDASDYVVFTGYDGSQAGKIQNTGASVQYVTGGTRYDDGFIRLASANDLALPDTSAVLVVSVAGAMANSKGNISFSNYGAGKVLVSDVLGNASWGNAPIITTGTTAPSSTPNKVGDIFIDTAGKKLYFATGVSSSADWVIAN